MVMPIDGQLPTEMPTIILGGDGNNSRLSVHRPGEPINSMNPAITAGLWEMQMVMIYVNDERLVISGRNTRYNRECRDNYWCF